MYKNPGIVMCRVYVCILSFVLWEVVVCGAGVCCLVLGGWFVLMEGWQVGDFAQLLGIGRRG